MHMVKVVLNRIQVCKASSSSCMQYLSEVWFPISFTVTFADMRELPTKWSLWVLEDEHVVNVQQDAITIIEGMLCILGVGCCGVCVASRVLCVVGGCPNTCCPLQVLYIVEGMCCCVLYSVVCVLFILCVCVCVDIMGSP